MSISFRNSAAFGKRIEYYIVGLMLKEGLDVYMPLVDDDAIDAVVKKPNGKFVEIQIKARSKDECLTKNSAYFSNIQHSYRKNYWFIFYSERLDKIWILSSKEFIKQASQIKSGKHAGSRSLKFNGYKSKTDEAHVLPRLEKFIAKNFERITKSNPDGKMIK